MAQKAKKSTAKANAATLRNLHLGSLIANGLFLAFYIVFRSRSLTTYLFLVSPSLACQFFLERAGRPQFDSAGALRKSGEDLGAAGLTESMFDVIWVTWGTTVLVVLFGNKLWFLWALVPAFGLYKGYGLLGSARQMAGLGGFGGASANGAEAAPAMNRRQRRAA